VDRVRLKFRSMEDVDRGDLPGLLRKHLAQTSEVLKTSEVSSDTQDTPRKRGG